MKKLFVVFLLNLSITIVSHGEIYKKIKVGLGFGYGGSDRPTYSAYAPALFITLEPAYRIKDNLAIGLRIEPGAIGGRGSIDDVMGIVSFTVNGQYYLGADLFRPFVGAGFGIYSRGINNFETKFGFYPRVGFDVGHFSMSLDYNFIPAPKLIYTDYVTQYFGVRIGAFFGGGKN